MNFRTRLENKFLRNNRQKYNIKMIKEYKNLPPITDANGISWYRGGLYAEPRLYRGTPETVTQEMEISIRTSY